MGSYLQTLIDYFSIHPSMAMAAVFAASLLEAVAVIGTFIPGSSIVFAGGVLIGLGALDLWWTMGLAIVGAILGDGLSYWVGHHYRSSICTIWPIKKYPELFARGQEYFSRNGGKSVFFGRFLGPVRAIVPVTAGIAGMSVSHFFLMNVLSAVAWAAAHILPGVLFGASLQVAGAVSSRLLILLLIIAAFLWVVVKCAKFAHTYGWTRVKLLRDSLVLYARGKAGLTSRIILSLLDPARAESQALLFAACLLVGGSWLFLGIVHGIISSDALAQFDQSIYILLQELRTRWGDSFMVAVAEVGGPAGTGLLILLVSVLFAIKRRWHTLAYWIAAAGVAEVLVWTLKYTLNRVSPTNVYTGIDQFSFPGAHTTVSIVMYGFLAFLLGRGKSDKKKIAITLVATIVIILVESSRLYLGVRWISNVLGSLSLGLIWLALLSIAYIHHLPTERLRTWPFSLVIVLVLGLSGSFYVGPRHRADVKRYAYRPQISTMSLPGWTDGGWHQLPFARSELSGEFEEPLSVQWAGTAAQIGRAMTQAGWQVPEPWGSKASLLWLLPNTSSTEIPVLPKFDQGREQKITFTKAVGAQERVVLRLWRFQYQIDTEIEGAARSLWSGMVTIERLEHPLGLVTIAKTQADFTHPQQLLAQDLRGQQVSIAERARRGIRVLLVWPARASH
ncbi:MAG: VTT domain-containing protein [Paralcaligenes sp.]